MAFRVAGLVPDFVGQIDGFSFHATDRQATRGLRAAMNQREAKALLGELWPHTLDRDAMWYQEWKTGNMIMWDNRCVMDRREPFDPSTLRVMHRTTVEGERPPAAL